jgi:hypothetical protein
MIQLASAQASTLFHFVFFNPKPSAQANTLFFLVFQTQAKSGKFGGVRANTFKIKPSK